MKHSDRLLIGKGPAIEVEVHHTSTHITKILLTPSDSGFFCRFVSQDKAPLQDAVIKWLKNYAQGKSGPSLPLKLEIQTPFSKKVLEEMQKVPFGDTLSYKDLAKQALSPNAARAVGNVCRSNQFPLVIPCHRVISAQGTMAGFAFGVAMKEELLAFESSRR